MKEPEVHTPPAPALGGFKKKRGRAALVGLVAAPTGEPAQAPQEAPQETVQPSADGEGAAAPDTDTSVPSARSASQDDQTAPQEPVADVPAAASSTPESEPVEARTHSASTEEAEDLPAESALTEPPATDTPAPAQPDGEPGEDPEEAGILADATEDQASSAASGTELPAADTSTTVQSEPDSEEAWDNDPTEQAGELGDSGFTREVKPLVPISVASRFEKARRAGRLGAQIVLDAVDHAHRDGVLVKLLAPVQTRPADSLFASARPVRRRMPKTEREIQISFRLTNSEIAVIKQLIASLRKQVGQPVPMSRFITACLDHHLPRPVRRSR